MNIAYTNDSMSAVGYLDFVGFDTSIGNSGNQVKLKLHASQKTELAKGSLIFSPETEYGGIVQDIQSKLETDGQRYVYYSGPSWTGRLQQRIIKPPAGQDHYHMEGEANSELNALMEYLDLDYLFEAPDTDSGIELDIDLERFADGYSALRQVATEYDCRLSTVYSNAAKKVVLQFIKRETHGNYTSDNSPITVTVGSAVNHLVCAGQGELQNRVVLDLYIGADGEVQNTPYYTGNQEIVSLYENTSADAAKLREEGTKNLQELQNVNQVGISVDDGSEDLYALDDVIAGIDPVTGIQASSTIAKKVVSVDYRGFESYRYEAAEVGSTVATTLSTESTGGGGGGTTYSAGYGIEITNNEISAEVGPTELQDVEDVADAANTNASNAAASAGQALSAANTAQQTADGKADAEHTHPASDITSGTLPIARGGTNATTAKAAQYNLLNDMGNDTATANPADGHEWISRYSTPSATNGVLVRRPLSHLWNYVYSKIKAIVTPSDIDAANATHTHAVDDVTGLTASRALVSDSNGHPAVSGVTATELSRLDGVTSNVQTQLNNKAATDHTHNYAGSSSAGGAATSANKLSTARTITLTGAVNGSATFDGSENITITTTGDSEAASFLAAHPVGSIYACNSATSPQVTYGGTWEPLASADSFKWLRTS